MNYIDIFLGLIVISSAVSGYRRGFIRGMLDVVRWVGSLVLGLIFYSYVVRFFNQTLAWNSIWAPPAAFLLTVVFWSVLMQVIIYQFRTHLPPAVHNRPGNLALGLIPGVFNGLLSAAILAVLLLAIPLPDYIAQKIRTSAVVNQLACATDRLETLVAPNFEAAVSKTLNNMVVAPGAETVVELPFKLTRTRPRPDLETKMLRYVNAARRENGLEPLAADTALRTVARQHAKDMFRRGYFSHYSPEGTDPFGRIRRAKIRFLAAGENLALAPTIPIAHQGLMNSPGHRANILQKRFGRVGIGVIDGGVHGLMITQNFRN